MRSVHHPRRGALRRRWTGSRWRDVAPIVVALAGTAGCYRYAPTDVGTVEPQAEIRVTLNDEGYRSVLPGASAAPRRTIEGRFLESTNDTLALSVWIGEAYRGTPFETTYQRVPIPRADVVMVENRRLSKPRTALLAAGVVAVIVTLIDQLDVVQIFGDGDPTPPDPPSPDGLKGRR